MTETTPQPPTAPRTTTITYLLALLLIAGISITSHVLTNRIVLRQQTTALLVNTAGRQRMLSQRITLLAENVVDRRIPADTGQARLQTLVDRMDRARQQLLHGDPAIGLPGPGTPELRAIYFSQPVRLEQQVDDFLQHARALTAKSNPEPDDVDLRAMQVAANAPLLNGLDQAVAAYQAASEHDVRHLRHVMNTLTGAMLLVLVLEALLIYRPLFNRLSTAIAQLVKASTTDFLTGVMNRKAFTEAAQREIARAGRSRQTMCLIMADIDRFKTINDRFGHAAGDLVLQHFAATAEQNLRASDLLARMGGEEFAMLLPGTDLEVGIRVADRIRERFAGTTAAMSAQSQRISATVSLGVVCLPEADLSAALAEADRLLYKAKAEGRNRVCSGEMPVQRAPEMVRAAMQGIA